jgi:hypothetical protein
MCFIYLNEDKTMTTTEIVLREREKTDGRSESNQSTLEISQ